MSPGIFQLRDAPLHPLSCCDLKVAPLSLSLRFLSSINAPLGEQRLLEELGARKHIIIIISDSVAPLSNIFMADLMQNNRRGVAADQSDLWRSDAGLNCVAFTVSNMHMNLVFQVRHCGSGAPPLPS